MKKLTMAAVALMSYSLAKQLMDWDEPIPPFSTRFPGKLESCLEMPFMTAEGNDLYPNISDKGAILFYLMVKNHPFQNGNKRIAVTALFTFLFLNERWMSISNNELYEVAIQVAESRAESKEAITHILKNVLEDNIRPISELLNKPNSTS